MTNADGFVSAYLLDGKGGGRELDMDGVRQWSAGDGFLWVHLDRSGEAAQTWLREHSGLDELVGDALLAEDARPRSAAFEDGMVVKFGQHKVKKKLLTVLSTTRAEAVTPAADQSGSVAVKVTISDPKAKDKLPNGFVYGN